MAVPTWVVKLVMWRLAAFINKQVDKHRKRKEKAAKEKKRREDAEWKQEQKNIEALIKRRKRERSVK